MYMHTILTCYLKYLHHQTIQLLDVTFRRFYVAQKPRKSSVEFVQKDEVIAIYTKVPSPLYVCRCPPSVVVDVKRFIVKCYIA